MLCYTGTLCLSASPCNLFSLSFSWLVVPLSCAGGQVNRCRLLVSNPCTMWILSSPSATSRSTDRVESSQRLRYFPLPVWHFSEMCGSRFSRDWNSFLASGCDDVSEEQAAIVQLLCVFRVVALGWSDGGSVTALVLGWLIKMSSWCSQKGPGSQAGQ